MTDKTQADAASEQTDAAKLEESAPVITQHKLKLGKTELKYSTHVGLMPLKNDQGEIEAEMFYTAYTLDGKGKPGKRPLTFVFNGGPGSSSVWLHLGALGPKRVKMHDEGWMPAPPYKLVDNPHTWLDQTDLVFIDPVGTGFSRAAKPDGAQKYWSLQGDIESVGTFIRMFLTRYERWASPLFLAGESYGTTRAAGVAGHLIEKGIAFNGLILISTVLNFQTLRFTHGNELPYALYLPTYTATAWYHGKLPDDLAAKPLRDVLDEVEAWAENEYTVALMKGDKLSADERAEVITRLARYTGLNPQFIDNGGLGINIMLFCKELLRDQKRSVGRLDSRFKGIDAAAVTMTFDHDPSYSAIMPPYTAMFNDYIRRDLKYQTDREYEILSFEVFSKWEYQRGEFPDTSEAMRKALAQNPYMQLLICTGYYDLATPHFATQYTLNHTRIDPELRGNIHTADYSAGHMFYLDVKSLAKFKDDVSAFFGVALKD
ncbi:MAG: peptidase S10 [Anaerolineaceae bacterium]|nr:MAG: peptidase S10 [Anaerolineaceae bacterium]